MVCWSVFLYGLSQLEKIRKKHSYAPIEQLVRLYNFIIYQRAKFLHLGPNIFLVFLHLKIAWGGDSDCEYRIRLRMGSIHPTLHESTKPDKMVKEWGRDGKPWSKYASKILKGLSFYVLRFFIAGFPYTSSIVL